MRFTSPLRYPGGKTSLSGFVTDVIDLNDLRGCIYFEPYVGGAGLALNLLRERVVSEIHINDADRRVYAFWYAALNENERFVGKVLSVPLTIEEWYNQRVICENPGSHSKFDVGFSAFYMNRCNRSGVLTGAGPIGGYRQAGKWRLGVRFSREQLAERFFALARMKERIKISDLDAVDFLKTKLPRGRQRANTFVYLDPPYVKKGQRLYLNSYSHKDHSQIARYLDVQFLLPWTMSYDDTELIRKLYWRHQISFLPIRYSLQEKRSAKELVIAPVRLLMPRTCRIGGPEALMSNQIGLNS